MKARKLPSQWRLKLEYEYDPETGILSKNGYEVGCYQSTGYKHLKLDGVHYLVHRIIWKYMTGEDPNIVDHINRVKDDNRWKNLRNVNISLNQRNKAGNKNSCGVPGLFYRPEYGKWAVNIRDGKKQHHIGHYTHALDAIQARIEAEEIFWGKSHAHSNLK